jgi:hypothetical protein
MRWEHQDTTVSHRLCTQIPALLGLGALLLFSYEVQRRLSDHADSYGEEGVGSEEQVRNGLAALFVTLVNAGLPWVVVALADYTEVHQSESEAHASMMLKLVAARFVNTVLIPFNLMPLEETFSERSFAKIQAILIADCFMGPMLRLLDGYTRIVNHRVLAPKARTQEALNELYVGSWWHLGERYSAVLTTLFVSLFYSALMPSNIVITAFSFFGSYWADKYMLFHRWEVHPPLNAKLTHLAHLLVIFIVWVHMMVTTYFFAGWPFHRTIDSFTGTGLPTIEAPSCFVYCSYTKTANENDTQKAIIQLYNYISVLLSAGLLVFAIHKCIAYLCSSTLGCSSTGSNSMDDDAAEYTSCVGIDAYVPAVKIPGVLCRLGCVEISEMSTTHREQFQGQAVVLKCNADERTYDVRYDDGRVDVRVHHGHLKPVDAPAHCGIVRASFVYPVGGRVWGPQYVLTRDPLLPNDDVQRMHHLFGRVCFFDPDDNRTTAVSSAGDTRAAAIVLDPSALSPAFAAAHNQV